MRFLILLAILFFAFSSSGTGGSSYDSGYDAGFDGASKGALYSINSSYREGYEDGADDAYYYDLGCNDKNRGNPPRHSSTVEYMEGYNEC